MRIDVGRMWGRKNKAVVFCYVTIFIALITFLTDFLGLTVGYSAFGRSGSIMVLAGAILEYQTGALKAVWGELNKANSVTDLEIMLDDGNVSKLSNQKTLAHVVLIFGTLIWGFGDLLKYLV